ncbi:hypothetical protein VNO77_14963 [Canavalia gladiata]|uniref:Uncharacterized protein n=1 Tax=Canavalia gladiata TaxID=3824 RepID=A0AAN9M290_CANGL
MNERGHMERSLQQVVVREQVGETRGGGGEGTMGEEIKGVGRGREVMLGEKEVNGGRGLDDLDHLAIYASGFCYMGMGYQDQRDQNPNLDQIQRLRHERGIQLFLVTAHLAAIN